MGFGWLRHLRAADSALARANARALVDDWITQRNAPRRRGLATPVVARRLISWLSQSPLILEGADRAFYKRFLRSHRAAGELACPDARHAPSWRRQAGRRHCARQRGALHGRFVRRVQAGAPFARRGTRPPDPARRRAYRPQSADAGRSADGPAAAEAGLCQPGRRAASSRHAQRLDRMMPALRLFRHGDGALALFNGMSATAPDPLATLLAYNDARAQPIENAPHSGYQRLQARGTLVIMDAGAAAAAGLFGSRARRLPVLRVLRGAAPHRGELRRAAAGRRPVAAGRPLHGRAFDPDDRRHVVLPVRRAEGSGAMLGTPILAGPERVTMQREMRAEPDEPAIGVVASHDGYRAGIRHRAPAPPHAGDRPAIDCAAKTALNVDACGQGTGRHRRLRHALPSASVGEGQPDLRTGLALLDPAAGRTGLDASTPAACRSTSRRASSSARLTGRGGASRSSCPRLSRHAQRGLVIRAGAGRDAAHACGPGAGILLNSTAGL